MCRFFFWRLPPVVAGRGEQVRPIQVSGSRWIVLVNPGFPVETQMGVPAAFLNQASRTSALPGTPAVGQPSVLDWSEIIPLAENDFEAPVFAATSAVGRDQTAILSRGS